MRGEYMSNLALTKQRKGSPPHARGILLCFWEIFLHMGITPACAGNTRYDEVQGKIDGDHPRMRGEYDITELYTAIRPGSPPHARGIH